MAPQPRVLWLLGASALLLCPLVQCALCPKPDVANGELSWDKEQYLELETVIVQCGCGYGLLGPQSITCSENGTWSPEVPKCEWKVPTGCEQVLAGQKLLQCLGDPEAARLALEVYKLALEIRRLEEA